MPSQPPIADDFASIAQRLRELTGESTPVPDPFPHPIHCHCGNCGLTFTSSCRRACPRCDAPYDYVRFTLNPLNRIFP